MQKNPAYSVFSFGKAEDLGVLKQMFPSAEEVNEMNFVLFSTGGVHGDYNTLEDAEDSLLDPSDNSDNSDPSDPNDTSYRREISFLIIHPRLVCIKYGVVTVRSQEDVEFLKLLRRNSFRVMTQIGIR